ncbi:MAG: serine--tRNA ligase [Devosia sp.]
MYDINWIKANPETFDRGLTRRGLSPLSAKLLDIDAKRRAAILALNEMQEKRNRSSKEIGQAKAQKDNARAEALMAEVAGLKDKIPAAEADERAAKAELDRELEAIPNLPLEDAGIPDGPDETANVEYFGRNTTRDQAAKVRAPKPAFSFRPKEHYELGEAMGMMDFEIAAKLSGSRFVVLKSQLARLERAIGQFMLDLHTNEHGYTEVQPPLLVRDEALRGTAQLPKFEVDLFGAGVPIDLALQEFETLLKPVFDQLDRQLVASLTELDDELAAAAQEQVEANQLAYGDTVSDVDFETHWKPFLERNHRELRDREHRLLLGRIKREREEILSRTLGSADQVREQFLDKQRKLYLIPTAEVPLTNLVRESILAEDALPLRYTALTPCFRSEAGSAGRDTRGMLRQHQFNKVEMVSITTPETSIDEHERMLGCAETVLQKLGIHYRVMTLSTGDMGFGSQKTYDIEAWLPGQDTYREISSVSVCGDFQAQRMKTQYRPKGSDKKGALPYVHTLNGSGVAVGRALIAVMENYQQEDGSIAVPDVLRPYMGGLTHIGAKN